jgi:BirA family biotin operon repressor/biotin-[acetyl-CoA-carboxylase] ligase
LDFIRQALRKQSAQRFMMAQSDVLMPDVSLIRQELNAGGCPGVQIHAFERLYSTSAWLKEHLPETVAASTKEYLLDNIHLCVADWQTAGVGRRGRQWQTQAGNITFSLLSHTQKPAGELMGLSLVTGIAVVDCLQHHLGVQLRLKWPNDVLLDDAKLGGLLTELSAAEVTHEKPLAGTRLFTGIGVNLLHDPEVVGLGIGATSLQAAGIGTDRVLRDRLIGQLASAVLVAHQRFLESGWQPFSQRWQALDWLLGREVSVQRDEYTELAVARGVNAQGALLVERDGRTLPVYSGNVSIRRRS